MTLRATNKKTKYRIFVPSYAIEKEDWGSKAANDSSIDLTTDDFDPDTDSPTRIATSLWDSEAGYGHITQL